MGHAKQTKKTIQGRDYREENLPGVNTENKKLTGKVRQLGREKKTPRGQWRERDAMFRELEKQKLGGKEKVTKKKQRSGNSKRGRGGVKPHLKGGGEPISGDWYWRGEGEAPRGWSNFKEEKNLCPIGRKIPQGRDSKADDPKKKEGGNWFRKKPNEGRRKRRGRLKHPRRRRGWEAAV